MSHRVGFRVHGVGVGLGSAGLGSRSTSRMIFCKIRFFSASKIVL